MRTLRINRVGAINEVAHTQQTAFFAHIVETGLFFRPDKTTIENGHHNASTIKSHVMQNIDFQLCDLSLRSAVITIHTTLCGGGLHLIGQPTFLLFLRLEVVRAVAHNFHKTKRIDGFNRTRVGGIHRNAVEPLRRIEQLHPTVSHSLEILRINRNVILIDANAQIGTTLQCPLAQISLRIVNRIGRVVLVGKLHPVNVGRHLCMNK